MLTGLQPAVAVTSLLTSLARRRQRWHRAEANRIRAALDRFSKDKQIIAALGIRDHEKANAELEALLRGIEPAWDGEQEETEKHLDREPESNDLGSRFVE